MCSLTFVETSSDPLNFVRFVHIGLQIITLVGLDELVIRNADNCAMSSFKTWSKAIKYVIIKKIEYAFF